MKSLCAAVGLMALTACTSVPSRRPVKFACPGTTRLDSACHLNVKLKAARDVPDMFQKEQLRALAQAKAYLDQDPHLVLQIQGQSAEQGGQIAAFAKTYLLSLGGDGNRISTIAFESDKPEDPKNPDVHVVLVMWSNEAGAK
jgi:hypothetical protein